MKISFHTVLVMVVPLAGCAAESASHGAPDVTDSAGVRIVTSQAPLWGNEDRWRLAAEPRLIIGGLDGDSAQQLYQVAGALKSGEHIIIANAGTQEVRFYTLDGRLQSRIGGEGDGPGEFRRIESLHRMGHDSLLVFDATSRRVTVFDRSGELGRTIRLESPPGASVTPVGGFADGRLLVSELVVPRMPELGRFRATLTLRIYHADGSAGDSVGFDYYQEMYIEAFERGIRPWPPPFGRREMTIVHDDRFATGSMDSYEVRVVDPTGKPTLIVRRADPLVPISSELLDAEIARLTATLPRRARLASARSSLLAAGTPDHLPTFGPNTVARYPPVTGMLFDAEENLWVLEYPGPTGTATTWSVFDPEGLWMGAVAFAAGLTPLDIGRDEILVHWRDELDVEYVGLVDLTKP